MCVSVAVPFRFLRFRLNLHLVNLAYAIEWIYPCFHLMSAYCIHRYSFRWKLVSFILILLYLHCVTLVNYICFILMYPLSELFLSICLVFSICIKFHGKCNWISHQWQLHCKSPKVHFFCSSLQVTRKSVSNKWHTYTSNSSFHAIL